MESPHGLLQEPPAQPSRQTQRGVPDARLRQAQLIISWVLRGGVLLSAAIILLGVVMFYVSYVASGDHSSVSAAYPHSLGEVAAGIAHGDPQAVIALGLLVLLVTPVLRVAVSIVTFALERDWVFVAITALVLGILIVSFLLGHGGA